MTTARVGSLDVTEFFGLPGGASAFGPTFGSGSGAMGSGNGGAMGERRERLERGQQRRRKRRRKRR